MVLADGRAPEWSQAEAPPSPPRGAQMSELQQVQRAANIMARYVRGWHARHIFKKQKQAAQVLGKTMRGVKPRRELMSQRNAARTIQAIGRRRIAAGDGSSSRANIALVQQFISALEENDLDIVRTLCTPDFVYDRQMKGHIVQTRCCRIFSRTQSPRKRSRSQPRSVLSALFCAPVT